MYRSIGIGLFCFGAGWFWFCYNYVMKDSRSVGKIPLQIGLTITALMLALPSLLRLLIPIYPAVILGLMITYIVGYLLLKSSIVMTLPERFKILTAHFAGCTLVMGVPAGLYMAEGRWFY
jgi:hypothetical protein